MSTRALSFRSVFDSIFASQKHLFVLFRDHCAVWENTRSTENQGYLKFNRMSKSRSIDQKTMPVKTIIITRRLLIHDQPV